MSNRRAGIVPGADVRLLNALIFLALVGAVAVCALQISGVAALPYSYRVVSLAMVVVGSIYVLGMLSGARAVGVFHRSFRRAMVHTLMERRWLLTQSHAAGKQGSIEAIYDAHSAALQTVREFERSGFEKTNVSVVNMVYQSDGPVTGCYANQLGRLKSWGRLGVFWNELWSSLSGGDVFVVPGIGPVMLVGPIVDTYLATLQTAGGANPNLLETAIHGLGIPKDRAHLCEVAIRTRKTLLLISGTADELTKAKALLGTTGAAVKADLTPRRRAAATAEDLVAATVKALANTD
jgi:hypothetical protein